MRKPGFNPTVLLPRSHKGTKEMELSHRLKTQKCRQQDTVEVLVVVKCLNTDVTGMSWSFWSCSFLPAAWPLFCLFQHHHHPKARLPNRISPSSSLTVACFSQRGVELNGQSRIKTALQENQRRALCILLTRLSPDGDTHASSASVLPLSSDWIKRIGR